MRLAVVLSLTMLLVIPGCFYTVAESPEVLPPGRYAVSALAGAMVSPWTASGSVFPFPSELAVQGNLGVFPGVDAGLRLSALSGLYGEIRGQILREPLLVCAGLGASYSGWYDVSLFTDWDGERAQVMGLYPTITVGTRSIYGGARVSVQRSRDKLEGGIPSWDRVTYLVTPELLFGGAFGERLQVIPEGFLALNVSGGKLSLGGGLGVGLRYSFGTELAPDYGY
jgi:hypothetical protein